MIIINIYENPGYCNLGEKNLQDNKSNRGKLKIFFGYAAGVGKTYAMLNAARDVKKAGKDIVIGYIEYYSRPETMKLLEGMEIVEPKSINYSGLDIKEFDLDKALERKPQIIVVDEFAHTNAKGQRHRKRWEDIEELLNSGIDVYTTLNVQHIESMHDVVESITHIHMKETIPDRIFDDADNVELIDIEPEELLKRFIDGKIYSKEQTKIAINNFFTKKNLYTLRETALRRMADRVNYEVEGTRVSERQITVTNVSDQNPFYSKSFTDKLMDSYWFSNLYGIYKRLSNQKNKKRSSTAKKLHIPKISLIEVLKTIGIMAATIVVAKIFDYVGFTQANFILAIILGVIMVYIVTTGYTLGIISSIAGVLLFNYFFTAPRYSLMVYDKSEYATFPIMIIVSIIIGTLTNRIRREAQKSSTREKTTQILYKVSQKLLSANGTADVISIGITYISKLTDKNVVCYLVEDSKLSSPFIYNCEMQEKDNVFLREDEQAAANWAFLNEKESGLGTDTFYSAKCYYVPIKGHKDILGIIGVYCSKDDLKPYQKYIFETVTSQMAIALERENFSKEQETSKVEIERERLRSNLLRSISHDLRSPLAGIKGAVSTIIENGESISEETKKNLLQGIFEDTEWLIRLIENLLSMTRFDEGKIQINKNLELVEEVISEVVQRCSKMFKEHRIKVTIPEDVIMVSMDGSLIEQVLINLIDNAVKFTPKGSLIEIKAYEENKDVFFEVIDNGPGIAKEIIPYIFDRFYTNGSAISDSRRGVGLGLAICKSIVEAHGGNISAANKKDGGAIFKFYIPEEENEDGY